MATELGAQVIKKRGTDVAKLVAETAIEQEAGLIVIGRPQFSLIGFLLNRNLIRKILKYASDIDIIIVS